MLGSESRNSAVGIVGIAPGATAGSDRGGAVVAVVGVRNYTLCVSKGLRQCSQVVEIVVGITYGVGAGTALFHVLHHTVGEVVVVSGGGAGFGIVDLGKGTGVVVLVGLTRGVKGQNDRPLTCLN